MARKYKYLCVDTRSAAKSPVSVARPKTRAARDRLLLRHGRAAFLVPEGTPAKGDVPSYPLVTEDGCFHCGMARAAYTRIGQALSKERYPETYKALLKTRRRLLINKALSFADRWDPGNACNWAFAARKRYLRIKTKRR